MEVTWDPRKAAANHKKHKVSFEEASTVLADPAGDHWRGPGSSASSTHGRRHAQNVGSMKKARSRVRDELRRSYKRSDFPAGFIRGKYAARLAAGSNVVVLSPENAAAFPTSDAVNEALNGLVRVAKSARLTSRSSGRRSR